jgi:hypothetical protein
VSDIAKGILGGGWSLIAGWILPTAINVLLLRLFVVPSLRGVTLIEGLTHNGTAESSVIILGVSVVFGLTLSALQTPLYRVLEGYLLWPGPLAKQSRRHQIQKKLDLEGRVDAIRIKGRQAQGRALSLEDKKRLEDLVANRRIARFERKDRDRTAVQQALLRERLRRFPVDNDQVAPTRLGNAIRRLEEYGYQRYRLDSQALWYELTASAPKQLSRQVDLARAGVDFFVCLLYGNILVSAIALAALGAYSAKTYMLLPTAISLIVVVPVWYKLAEVATDDWALAVRALVDIGRKSLAEALGLCLPRQLSREREMWSRYSRFVRRPYSDSQVSGLDGFRMPSDGDGKRPGSAGC